jgi:alkylated DNA repair dioxygenase AlkB
VAHGDAPAVRADVEFERLWLDETSWVDVARGWVAEPVEAFRALRAGTAWQSSRIFRYDRWVEEPRLGAMGRPGPSAAHAVLTETHRALQRRYGVTFDGFGLALYRDGRDGQAFHRDRSMRWLEETVIGVLTLGGQRPWLLRPRANRYAHESDNDGATHDLAPAGGDLFVMGGRCQADWEHSVPKVRGVVAERISVQWRWTSRRGRPVEGANYNAPRFYSRR